jgi:hypothetical protein
MGHLVHMAVVSLIASAALLVPPQSAIAEGSEWKPGHGKWEQKKDWGHKKQDWGHKKEWKPEQDKWKSEGQKWEGKPAWQSRQPGWEDKSKGKAGHHTWEQKKEWGQNSGRRPIAPSGRTNAPRAMATSRGRTSPSGEAGSGARPIQGLHPINALVGRLPSDLV